MREIRTEIEIAAPPEVVWRILTEFDRYPDWNPFIREAVGVCAPGERLTIRTSQIAGREYTFRPRILVAEPGRQLRWIGRLGAPGIFDGEHAFTIEPIDAGRVRFLQHEQFRGLLVPLLFERMLGDTRAGFSAMNEALKARAQKAVDAS